MINDPDLNIQPNKIIDKIAESPGTKELPEINPLPEPTVNTDQTAKLTINNLLLDISDSYELNEVISGTNSESLKDENSIISPTISQTANTLKNINIIKDELCKLPLDTCELEYVTNNVFPLLTILYELSTTSQNLASCSSLLSISSVVNPKKHELKDTLHLVYKINEECEDVYDVLKKRLNFVLKDTCEK